MQVRLSHAPNPDVRGGYWERPKDKGRAVQLVVPTMEEAAKECRAYIERNGLGAGNWTGGEISVDGRKIASVSYNGRVWDLAGQEIALAPRGWRA
jgi:hypothetical protein